MKEIIFFESKSIQFRQVDRKYGRNKKILFLDVLSIYDDQTCSLKKILENKIRKKFYFLKVVNQFYSDRSTFGRNKSLLLLEMLPISGNQACSLKKNEK